jgi:two-component system response regulator
MQTANAVEILLVEDNPHDAELTLRALRKRKLANNVLHVNDGEEALHWLFGTGPYADRNPNHKPKLVLLDLKLPKVDGLEVLRQVRAREETKFIPMVILTSSREDQDVVESYRFGVNSYIVKPVNFDNFSEAVASVGHYWILVNQEPKLRSALW